MANQARGGRTKRGASRGEKRSPRVDMVRQAIASFGQALRKVALYVHQTSGLEDFFVDTLAAMKAYHNNHGTITVVVKPFDFFFEGESVFSADNHENSPTYKLYQAGIRSLSFENGVVGPDLVALARILLKTPMELKEEDLASMLWRQGIPHIAYLQITSTEDAGDGMEGEAEGDNIEQLMAYLNKKFSGGDKRNKVNFRSFQSSDLELDSFINRTKTQRQLFDKPRPMSAVEIAYVRKLVEHERNATIGKGVELLFFLCKHAENPDDLQSIEDTFTLLFEQLFQQHEFDQLGRLLDAIQRLSSVARAQGAKEFLTLKQRLFAFFVEPEQFQALCDVLDHSSNMREATRFDVCAFLRILGTPMAELMNQSLFSVSPPTRRIFLLALLSGSADPNGFSTNLLATPTLKGERARELLIELLQIGSFIPKVFTKEQLEGYLQEGDAQIQRLSLRLFLHHYPDELLDMSGGFFKKADSSVLRSMFEVLCQNDDDGVDKLLAFVKTKHFKRLKPEDQVALFGVLGRSQKIDILMFFDEILGRKSRFFLPNVDREKRLALRGLEAFGSFRAQDILKKHDQKEYHSARIRDELAHSLTFYHIYIRAYHTSNTGQGTSINAMDGEGNRR